MLHVKVDLTHGRLVLLLVDTYLNINIIINKLSLNNGFKGQEIYKIIVHENPEPLLQRHILHFI